MKWFKKKMKRIKKASISTLFLWAAAKGLGGLALGILAALYYPRLVSTELGWTLLAVAIIISLPVCRHVFNK